jgi:Co/Zn/Cd efflux system component
MSMACCANDHCSSDNRQPDGRYRRVLWVALVLNGGMFLTEIVAGLAAGSAALQADAVDFLSDAANYGISLFVLGLVLVWRARAARSAAITASIVASVASPCRSFSTVNLSLIDHTFPQIDATATFQRHP